jgi:hypothetical protein
MKRQYTYIAFLLAGIFSFTISSQSAHVIWHTSHIHSECDHGDHEHDSNHDHKSTDHADENSLQYDNFQDHCFICEFEFSLAEEPGLFIPESISPHKEFYYIIKDNTRPSIFHYHSKSPRAPPVIIS